MTQKKNKVKAARRLTKKEVYALYGIEYKKSENGSAEYIKAPLFGWIAPLLVNGNGKIGRGVWHFSTLPGTGTRDIMTGDGETITTCATCDYDCPGCYGKSGCYNYSNVKDALAIRTVIARNFTEWFIRAILAQIAADKIDTVRIHATGDFFSVEYVAAWHYIAEQTVDTVKYWTYTKNPAAETAFNDLPNINVVHSIIPGIGFNFGHCDYILAAYEKLTAAGESVYICRCGIDKNQHCNTCKGCSVNEYVLFIEHSTEYKAEKDPAYETLRGVIESQEKPE